SPSFSACCTAAAAPGVHTLSLHDALPICIAPHARPPLGVSRKWRGSVALSPYSALGFSRAASIGEAKSCFPPVHRPTCRLACPAVLPVRRRKPGGSVPRPCAMPAGRPGRTVGRRAAVYVWPRRGVKVPSEGRGRREGLTTAARGLHTSPPYGTNRRRRHGEAIGDSGSREGGGARPMGAHRQSLPGVPLRAPGNGSDPPRERATPGAPGAGRVDGGPRAGPRRGSVPHPGVRGGRPAGGAGAVHARAAGPVDPRVSRRPDARAARRRHALHARVPGPLAPRRLLPVRAGEPRARGDGGGG